MIRDLLTEQSPLTILDAIIADMRRRLAILEAAREAYAAAVADDRNVPPPTRVPPTAPAPLPPPRLNAMGQPAKANGRGSLPHGKPTPAYSPDRHRVLRFLKDRTGAITVNDIVREVRCEPSVVRTMLGFGYVSDVGGYIALTPKGSETLESFDERVGPTPPPREVRTLPLGKSGGSGDDPAGGPFPRARLAILKLLSDGENRSKADIVKGTNYSASSVDKVAQAGMIEVKTKRGACGLYGITDAGREELERLEERVA